MISKVDIINKIKEKTSQRRVTEGDIVLVKKIKKDGESIDMLCRATRSSDGYFHLISIGHTIIYRTREKDLFINEAVSIFSTAYTELKLIGICDLDITIKSIKK